MNWHYFFLLMIFVYSFAILFSILTLFTEERTFHKYTKVDDFLKLLGAAFIEPFYFHPLSVFSAFKGYVDKIKGTHSWGEMTRKGFNKKL
jgi:hypothetical protein